MVASPLNPLRCRKVKFRADPTTTNMETNCPNRVVEPYGITASAIEGFQRVRVGAGIVVLYGRQGRHPAIAAAG
jgi:hypothetical protein